jgi:hypothetical protein
MARQVIIAEPSTPYALSLWMRTGNVKPLSNAGYAYAADGIAQFDAVQVVQGDETPQRFEEVPTAKVGVALILHEPIRYGQTISATLLNANPDFETVASEGSAEGWEISSLQQCFISEQVTKSGKRSAGVSVTGEAGSAIWKTSVSVQTGERLRGSGWMKAERVKGGRLCFSRMLLFRRRRMG